MKIIIETIPHDQHRYPTVGDWYYEGEDLHIKVSETEDWRHAALVAVHELVEVLICKHDGVSQQQVDAFDMKFEADRKEGNDDEPGDSPDAPYCQQHSTATGVERVLAVALGVNWSKYADALEALDK